LRSFRPVVKRDVDPFFEVDGALTTFVAGAVERAGDSTFRAVARESVLTCVFLVFLPFIFIFSIIFEPIVSPFADNGHLAKFLA
jgi:hypothetical protein